MNQISNPQKCFTIGYSKYTIDQFIHFLDHFEINTIIDVRSSPYSRFNPGFNRENLEKLLKKSDIGYEFKGNCLGGRYSDPDLLFPDGTVNYKKVQDTEQFKKGISQLLEIISTGKTVALMCAEKEPERCHRFILISRDLQLKGVKIIHIRPEIGLQKNEDLEKELINLLVDKQQKTISGDPVDYADLMYEKLNRKMGFRHNEARVPNRE